MEASAKQMAELEEKLVHEQSRTVNLSAKLEREGERRQTTQDELDQTKQARCPTRNESKRLCSYGDGSAEGNLVGRVRGRRISSGGARRIRHFFSRSYLRIIVEAVNSALASPRRHPIKARTETLERDGGRDVQVKGRKNELILRAEVCCDRGTTRLMRGMSNAESGLLALDCIRTMFKQVLQQPVTF